MEFVFDTIYNQKALTSMVKGVRKTVRRKRTARSRVFGYIVIAMAILMILSDVKNGFVFDAKKLVTIFAVLAILIVLIFEDSINGYIARKRMLPGTEKSKVTFREDGFFSETAVGNTEWKYDRILEIAEMKDYFVFVFGISHAQVYDKNSLSGGTVDEFRSFICEKTGKTIVNIK